MPNFANPDVTRAAEKETQNRIIGLICPFLPPRVFVKCPSIRKMDGRGGGDRNCISKKQVLTCLSSSRYIDIGMLEVVDL
jgi:hypothetical protein